MTRQRYTFHEARVEGLGAGDYAFFDAKARGAESLFREFRGELGPLESKAGFIARGACSKTGPEGQGTPNSSRLVLRTSNKPRGGGPVAVLWSAALPECKKVPVYDGGGAFLGNADASSGWYGIARHGAGAPLSAPPAGALCWRLPGGGASLTMEEGGDLCRFSAGGGGGSALLLKTFVFGDTLPPGHGTQILDAAWP
jgi:hypothetical protein